MAKSTTSTNPLATGAWWSAYTGRVEVEDLDESAPLVGEEEGRAAERIESEVVAHHRGEPVEGLAHVAGFERDVDLEAAIEGEHDGGSCEVTEQLGELTDLGGADRAGDRTSRQANFQCLAIRGGELGQDECRAVLRWRGLARASIPSRKPRGEGRVLDAALQGEGGRAEAAGFKGVEHLLLVLGGVAGAPGAVGLDDGAGGGIDERRHRGILRRNRPRRIVGFC